MYNVTDRFLVAVKESGNIITHADLYYNRMKVPIVTDLEVISGTITIDMTSAQRRSGTLLLADTDLISLNAQRTLEPYGLEIGIRIGVQYPDGDLEFVPIGIFQITDIQFSEEDGGLPNLTIVDRSHWLAEQSSKTGVEDYTAQSTFFAIQDLLTKSVFINVSQVTSKVDPASLPPDTIVLVVDSGNLTDIKIPGGTPMDGGSFWDDIQTLATSLGAEVFFDPDGSNVILRKVPDITNKNTNADAVLTVASGDYGTLIGDTKGLSRSGAYNAVQMTGVLPANAASTATPPTVFVYDSDPTSVTFYDITGGTNSGFGRIVFATTSDTMTTTTQLNAAATALLKKGLGLTKTLSVTMLCNPALDVADIIEVIHEDATTDLAMVSQISLDLAGGPMGLTTICPNQIDAILGGTGDPDDGSGGDVPPPPPPPPPPGQTTFTKTYNATWSQSYLHTGAQTSGSDSTHCYQGDAGDGQGVRFSLIGFNYTAIEADLAGATINSCSLKLNYEHWWYGAGGTAKIGTHSSTTSSPTTYPSGSVIGNRVTVSGWPNPGQKTVSLGTTIGQNFRDSTARGIAIGYNGMSTSRTYYGYASGFGHSKPPVLTIVYTV